MFFFGRSKASSMKYNFPHKEGTGIRPLIPHVSAECVDLINQLLAYDPDERSVIDSFNLDTSI